MDPKQSSFSFTTKHSVSRRWRRRQQQHYSQNNSPAFFLCVYVCAVFCTPWRRHVGHVWMRCLFLNFYKEYLFGFETLVFATSGSSIMRLQMVQNAAARLMTGRRRFDHISPILISYKMLTFVFKSLQSQAPYLSEAISTYKPNRSLRSSNLGLLSVSRSRLHCRGDRAFAVAGPSLWHKLPASIRAASSLSVFKCRLKKHLLSIAFI